jgi:predicted type IV restriction endonuclease
MRNHGAFLNSSVPEDEGLNDAITPGDFWVVEIPFSNGGAAKKRPILILWLDAQQDVTINAVTVCISEKLESQRMKC